MIPVPCEKTEPRPVGEWMAHLYASGLGVGGVGGGGGGREGGGGVHVHSVPWVTTGKTVPALREA